MSSEALRLFKQLNLQLEQEGRFQPREKGLSLIESAAEVRGGPGGGPELGRGLGLCSPRGSGFVFRRPSQAAAVFGRRCAVAGRLSVR